MSSMVLLVAFLSLFLGSHGQMTCGPKMSPRLLMDIPCDMSKSNFCTVPGSSYPYSSVRRYIFENQGLMRRMYGDQRHSVILRNEIDDIREKYDSLALTGWGKHAKYHPKEHRPLFGPRSAFVDPLVPEQLMDTYQQQTKAPTASPSSTTERSRSTETAASPAGQAEPSASNVTETSPPETSSPSDFDFEDETTTTTVGSAEELAAAAAATKVELKKDADQKEEPNSSSTSSTTTSTTQTASTSTESIGGGESFETEPIEKRGVNACPVKEEVIAPYWANNTRGETLALLNVYPFEQYVHYEKCSYENNQMFCRDGCRCEQQYRLHRLLAFDPKNECRGIFSDWFKFPSCCVCICYDLPETSVFYRINRRKSRL